MPMCRPCVASDSKSGYIYMTKGQQCNEYIHGVFATIKNYLLLLYHVRVVKPFRISHIILRTYSMMFDVCEIIFLHMVGGPTVAQLEVFFSSDYL